LKALHGAEARDLGAARVLRVLLLEDGRSDAELVAARLSEGGIHCEVVSVGSGEAFGAALEEGGVDVILADHALPGSDDLSALRLAGEVSPGVPFIVTSGALDEKLAKELLESGAADYVPKPRLERLLPAVRRATIGAEEAPTEGEEYLAMFESANVGQARADMNTGRFLRANARLCRITGYTERELLRATLADLAHPENRGESIGRFLGLSRGETTEYSGEERWVRKDGRVIWVSIDAALVRGISGRPLGVLATVQDITTRKRTREELAHLASFPRLSPTMIVETEVGGETTFVDPAARARFPDLPESGRDHPILADLTSVDRRIRESGTQPVISEVWVDDVLYQRLIFAIPGCDLIRLYVTDVTERRRAEAALKRSEERFRSLVRYASDIIMILDAEGVLLYESPAVERVLGFRPEERIGTNALSHVHPDDLEIVKSRFAALREEPRKRVSVEFRVRDKDGDWRCFEAIGTNLLDDPVVSGIVVNTRDITERRRTEEALRESEERFRWTFEQADENIFVVDLKSKHILDANAALQRSLGYTPEELKGMTIYDLVAHERESVDLNVDRVVAEGSTFVGERKYLRKDGSTVDVEVKVGAIPYGENQSACVVAHDITERKRTEIALRQHLSVLLALSEAGQILSSTLESEEIVTRLLEIMRSVAGLTAAVVSMYDQGGALRVWRSAGLEDLWPRVRFTPEAEAARWVALEDGEQQPFMLQRPGFEGEYLTGLCLPLKIRNRTVGVLEAYGRESLAETDMVEIISSLTSQAASALENARLYEALGSRERALRDLIEKLLGAQEEERRRVAYEVHDGLAQVAVAAHQNLQAFARRHAPESEKGKMELDRILQQVRATVSDARRVIANLRPTALDDLGLSAAISLEVERLNEEGYRITYEEHLGNRRLPSEIEIALYRVAQEALTNIRKHAATESVHIELRRRGGRVCLNVRDFGCGFDPAALEILGSGPGEQVGFAGMRERVAMLGGELEIVSDPGAGTLVAASIPLARTT
jgi:PAS domain S-box-containing protein